ncbi:hypothetical protein [Anaeroselena agilis]|uniref:Uncharacterized protein n=1 Tax=Anaeroselena agilis TaxID=3063788 RepID=A0ABU3NTX9_9FIRM|nr:hypothetical protein [Selenomonadales bacterium 4137-cl]
MRTYGKRLIRGAADKATKQAAESRDAVLWDILLTEQVCRCKIQGSSELIIARFPQNWATVPEWAKPGQAVRIAHRGGIRGYIEVVGFGRAIPTPVSGSATPTPSTPDNAILEGCLIKAIPQNPGMSVYITTGRARFNGVEYTVPAVAMAAGSALKMNMGIAMGEAAGVFSISAPSAGQFRYDLFSLSPSLVVTKTAGAAFTTVESKPALPSGHLPIGYLLVRGGQTVIAAADIGQIWSVPVPASIATTATDNGIAWSIVASVKDQYGNAITTSLGWNLAAAIASGDGSITPASGNTGSGSSLTFTYTEGTAGTLVIIEITLTQGEYYAYGQALIKL